MTAEIHGGCACSASRYTCSERPLVQMICHCRDCQRASGSAFAACLDDPALFAPICEVWLSRAKAWHPHLAQTLKFEEGPAPELIRDPIAAYFAARTQ